MSDQELIRQALEAKKNAYVPYSHFAVGAALETEDGKLFLGCNIENAAYSPTNCAERTAFFKAISEGYRSFKRIAIVGGRPGEEGTYCPPCGVCRQVMAEFCDPEKFRIILARDPEHTKSFLLNELLPEQFGPDSL